MNNTIPRYLSKYLSRSLLSIVLLSAGFSFASEFNYYWAHPSPQGNIVYGIAFQDELIGFAVTGCGNLLKSVDGGQNWEFIADPDENCNDFYDIVITESGTLLVSGGGGIIMRSADSGENWEIFNFPQTGRLYDLALIQNIGISAAGENGSLLVSFDDGLSWTEKGAGVAGYARHHYWKTDSECYMVGYGIFHRTLDGGNNWDQVAVPGFFGINEVYFVNNNTGYATEDFGVWKTTDGGSLWTYTHQFTDPFYRFRTLIKDEQHWFSVTYLEGGQLWETFDAGTSWELKMNYNSTGFPCLLENGNRIFFSSDLGDIFYTEDGGANIVNTIQNLAIFPSAPVTIIGKKPDGTLFANNMPSSGNDNGTFFRSDDGGFSWSLPDPSPGLRWITDIEFFDDQYGVLGSYNDIRYTPDGGETWLISNLPANFNLTNFALPANDRFFAGAFGDFPAGGGNLFVSSDHGASWITVGGGLPVGQCSVTNISFATPEIGYLSCLVNDLPRFYKTLDGGNTWNIINPSGIQDFITDMLWFDGNSGLAAVPDVNNGGIFKTNNGGANWEMVSSLRVFYFSQEKEGFIAAWKPGDTVFLESADNGITWTSYSPPINNYISGNYSRIRSLSAVEAGYVIGGDGNKIMLAVWNLATTDGMERYLLKTSTTSSALQVIPNIFREQALIRFEIASEEHIRIDLLDIRGQVIHSLVKRKMNAGRHEIKLNVNELNQNVISGIFIIALRTETLFKSAKVIILD